jgi:hypothetical protein
MGLGIIAGSLATLRPLFRKAFRSKRGVAAGRILPDKEMHQKPQNPNFSLPRPWKIGHHRSNSADSSVSSVRKSLIGWPLERAASAKRTRSYDDEELLWGWGPKTSSAKTGKQKFGNITTVSSDGDWDGAVATTISRDSTRRKSMKRPISSTSSYYDEDEQKEFGILAPLPFIPIPAPLFSPRGSSRGSRLGQQMKFQGELAAPSKMSRGGDFPRRFS